MHLESRIKKLSPNQRKLLARRIRSTSSNRREPASRQHLVAYLVPARGKTATDMELRHFLLDRLPTYMIPSTFVRLEALQLTPNGKIDRNALVNAPDTSTAKAERNDTSPRNERDILLVKIWSQILDVEPIGIHDNFFELGGHSLLAVQLLSQIRANLQIELPMRALFEAPTIAELTQYIDTVRWTRQESVSDSADEREEIVI